MFGTVYLGFGTGRLGFGAGHPGFGIGRLALGVADALEPAGAGEVAWEVPLPSAPLYPSHHLAALAVGGEGTHRTRDTPFSRLKSGRLTLAILIYVLCSALESISGSRAAQLGPAVRLMRVCLRT